MVDRSIALLRSPGNAHQAGELARSLGGVPLTDIPMPGGLLGDGEDPETASELDRTLLELLRPVHAGVVVYSRAYGAFSQRSRDRLSRLTGRPVVSAPGAVLAELAQLRAHHLSVVTPYDADRHAYEIGWLRANGFEIEGAINLGGVLGPDLAQTTAEQLLEGFRQVSHGDALYVACTMLPLAAVTKLRDAVDTPVVSATEALTNQAAAALGAGRQ